MARDRDRTYREGMAIGDDYWRLSTYKTATLENMRKKARDANYHVNKSAGRPETVAAMQRLDRGLVSYAKCTLKELRKFHKDRGLGKATTLGQRVLIKALEDADDNATFSKLLDLPAELRCLIYDFYILGFGADKLDSPTHPPLSQVCQLLRTEVLPVFFNSICFELSLQTTVWGRDALHHYRLRFDTYQFLGSVQPQYLALISRFNMRFVHGSGNWFTIIARLDKPAKVWRVELDLHERSVVGQEAVERTSKVTSGVMHGDSGEAKPLTMDVLYAIRRQVEITLE